MRTLYVIAGGIWKGAKWVWTVIVVAILVSVASALISGPAKGVVESAFNGIVNWFTILGTIQLITIGAIVFLTLLALISGIFTVIFKSYEPKYAPPPEVQAVFDYIKNDMEAKKQKEDLRQDRKKEAFIAYLRAVEETLMFHKMEHLWTYTSSQTNPCMMRPVNSRGSLKRCDNAPI